MTEGDRRRWDERYAGAAPAPVGPIDPPSVFAPYVDVFPVAGQALDLACGQGLAAAWLGRRGLTVLGLDVSAVALGQARELARRNGISDRCRFEVCDLDDGLPAGAAGRAFDVILCHKFRDRRLDDALIERLAPGGLLAIATLSEVGAAPGSFRATPGELTTAFGDLELVAAGEGDGLAWLLGRA